MQADNRILKQASNESKQSAVPGAQVEQFVRIKCKRELERQKKSRIETESRRRVRGNGREGSGDGDGDGERKAGASRADGGYKKTKGPEARRKGDMLPLCPWAALPRIGNSTGTLLGTQIDRHISHKKTNKH